METSNYKSIEEANNLLNQDDLPSSKVPPSPSRSQGRKSPSSSPLKSSTGGNNTNTRHSADCFGMELGRKRLALIGGTLLVTAVLIIVLASTLSRGHSDGGGGDDVKIKGISFHDSISGAFYFASASLSWITSHSYILKTKNQLQEVEVNTEKEPKDLIKNLTELHPSRNTKYRFSEDRKFVLFSTHIKPIYRHSTSAQYFIFDVENEKKTPLKPVPASANVSRLQYAAWSPVGKSLTFVYENDLYYVKAPSQEPVRLTYDGEPAVVFNGVPDWVYEEEVLSTDHAVYWSPSGTKLAFLHFNDTQVPQFAFPVYGDYHNAYTESDVFRYPKAGFTNPEVRLFVRDVTDPSKTSNVELLPPVGHTLGDDYLVGNVKFRDEGTLLVIWTNRVQNESIVSLCDVESGKCYVNLRESSSNGWAWVMPKKELFLANDGSAYFMVLPKEEGDDSFPHVAMVSTSSDRKRVGVKSFLSKGAKEVDRLLAIRRFKQHHHQLFYTSTLEGEEGARQLHLFVVDTESRKEKCLSCAEKVGRGCTYFSASFFVDSQKKDENVAYFVLVCKNDAAIYENGVAPFTATFQYTVDDDEAKLVEELTDNAPLKKKLADYDWPTKHHFEVPILDDPSGKNLKIRGRVFLPPGFSSVQLSEESSEESSSDTKKYPILFSIYSGPSTTKVNDRFALDWHSYMSVVHGFVVVNVDGRGSSMRGNNLRFAMYRRLGGPEIDDVILAAKYLLETSQWKDKLDKDRVGVWGWSYGGYATSHVLGRGSGVFTCGAAVAPVTSWNFYDSIYTERYMSTPDDNPEGYAGTRVMDPKRVAHFADVSYLLIHGTADDNVHFQNAMHITTALIQREIPFETQIYPDKNHAISGASYRAHLYSKLTRFFVDECQRKSPKPKSSKSKRSVDDEEEAAAMDMENEKEERAWNYEDEDRYFDHQTCHEKDLGDCL